MSNTFNAKNALLQLANLNMFQNGDPKDPQNPGNPKIEFSKSRDDRVQANYSGYDKVKGFDVRGIRAKSAATATHPKGRGYIRLSLSLVDSEQKRHYFNGALFKNDKKNAEKQPDFQGSLNLDNQADGPKMRLSAWVKKGAQAGDYLSIAVQEFLTREEAAAAKATGQNSGFDMDDDAPAPAPKSAAPAPRAPAQRNAPAPAAKTAAASVDQFDPMDDDIPF